MTRRDYKIIAEIIGSIKASEKLLGVGVDENRLLIDNVLSTQNPNYNPMRFWEAVEEQVHFIEDITKS